MHPSLFSQFDLTGKAVIVTGASRGLGVSFARGLVKAGCDLIVAARDMDRLRDVARDLEQQGRRVVPVQADICRQQDVESMVQRSVTEFGKLDILVNNAGISAVADAEAMTREQWQSVIDTNLTALFFCAQSAARQMLRQGSGKIINIASMYGISASSYVSQASYVTSKAGVLGLTRELAVEWAPRGVQVVALAPGFFRSDQTIWAFEQNKELGEKLLAKVPMGRMGKLEELEGTIVYLASAASDYMTGQALILDGGFSFVVNRRVLTLWDLVVYGVVLIQPIAPVGIFGVALKISNGHAVTTILIAMVAMMLTAVSYGRMATLYPSAGSAYIYVGRGFGPYAGFLVGWAMFLDYLIIPVLNVIYGALTIQRIIPEVPYTIWAVAFAAGITALNLRGLRSLARANTILLAAMCAVVGAFVILAVRYLLHQSGWTGIFSIQPFYNPATFDLRAVMTATSLAALTYIGFDGVTTLAEETQNPRRTIPLATVLVCLVTGIFSAVEVYLGQRVWPDYQTFPNLETAFLDVTQRVGGVLLFQGMAAVLIVACFGTGVTGLAAAARLLYGMGREDMLPTRLFGRLDAKRSQPAINIWIIGALALGGALVLSYERSAELINFGAFLAFMGVNLAAIRVKPRPIAASACAGLGFLFCVWIWWSLPLPAKMAGGLWFAAGLAWTAVKTRGFRVQPAAIDFVDTET